MAGFDVFRHLGSRWDSNGWIQRGVGVAAAAVVIASAGAGLLNRARLGPKAGEKAGAAAARDVTREDALASLTNQELRARVVTTAAALRAFYETTRAEEDAAHRLAMDDTDRAERFAAVRRRRSDEFDRTLRVDAVHVYDELRRRLGPAVMTSIVLPPAFYRGGSGLPLDASAVVPDRIGMSAGFAGVLADAIDQMARRLE